MTDLTHPLRYATRTKNEILKGNRVRISKANVPKDLSLNFELIILALETTFKQLGTSQRSILLKFGTMIRAYFA